MYSRSSNFKKLIQFSLKAMVSNLKRMVIRIMEKYRFIILKQDFEQNLFIILKKLMRKTIISRLKVFLIFFEIFPTSNNYKLKFIKLIFMIHI